MIHIQKSATADTRTCDVTKVTQEQLLESSKQHISDVEKALRFFALRLRCRAENHDWDKLEFIAGFYADFQTKFKETRWWDKHRRISRHHINYADGVPEDINLIDVLEHIADCVMAGMGRSGSVYELKLPDELLQRAFRNTAELLKAQVVVIPEPPKEGK
jgi:hypothetical protein